MEDIVRRSILRVSVHDREGVADSWRHGADAVALDLGGDGASDPTREAARALVRESIQVVRRGGAEVFARIERHLAYADIAASAWPGLTGIMLPSAETAEDVRDVAETLVDIERAHGLPGGSLQIFLLLGTASGVWRIRELIDASPRVSSVALDATSLCRSLGILPQEDFDPFLYATGRIVIECTAARVQPVGISFPLSLVPRILPPGELEHLVERSSNTGFKGAICPDPSWVEPCNQAFTPTLEQIEYYREVRRVFGAGVAQGRAAVPLDGRMLDVPVDERAKKQIALWERCRKRDDEKAAALQASAVG